MRLLKTLQQRARPPLPWLALPWLWLLAAPALALDPATRLEDYHRTVWAAREGAPSRILNMTQGADGWIWIATETGFYRFDGVQFEAATLPGQDSHGRVQKVVAAADGSLLLTYQVAGGLSQLHPDGRLQDLAPLHANFDAVNQYAQGADGILWAATERGLRYFKEGREHAIGAAEGIPAGAAHGVIVAPGGRLWLAHEDGIYQRPPGASRFDKVSAHADFASLVRAPDGAIWMAPPGQNRVERVAAAPATGTREPAVSQGTALFDRDGNLWSVHCPKRLCVLRPGQIGARTLLQPAAMSQAVLPELTGQPRVVMEDRAGAIWIATETTVIRLRDSRLTPSRMPNDVGVSMGLDEAGRAWAVDASTSTAWMLAAAGPVADRREALQFVSNSLEGAVLFASKRELIRRWPGREERFALPFDAAGKPVDQTVIGVQDDGRDVWIYTPRTGLIAYSEGQWRLPDRFNLPKSIMMTTPGGHGRYWLADSEGGLYLREGERLQRFDASAAGLPTLLVAATPFIFAGDQGIAIMQGASLRRLAARDPAVLRNVSGIAVSRNGDRWLNGGMGVVHVRAADWRASMQDPARPLRYCLLGEAEGYRGRAYLANRLPSAFADQDDQLWFGTTEGILHLDAGRPAAADLPPPLRITGLESDGVARAVHDGLQLPPAQRAINISYAAPGAARPELLRYQYRLAGTDAAWQDAGVRRTAFFTSLAPGRHRFEVRTVSPQTGWESPPVALEFSVAPTLVQSRWFQCLLALLLAALLFALHRWRLRLIAHKYRALLDERLDERNRIARELHDTLLQSVQGLMLKVQGAALRLPPAEPVRALLASALDQAETTVSEGRQKVRELRGAQAGEGLSLMQLLQAVASELTGDTTAVQLAVVGTARVLAAGVGAELFAIGREAMVNAWRHAGARAVLATLEFDDAALTLRVADDGAGIPAAYATAQGRPGHWGLAGMRERAAAIGARFEVTARAGKGSEIKLRLPAARAYRDHGRARRWRWALPL